jgi:hypothetical protein
VLDQVKHEPTLHNALTHAERMKDKLACMCAHAHKRRDRKVKISIIGFTAGPA